MKKFTMHGIILEKCRQRKLSTKIATETKTAGETMLKVIIADDEPKVNLLLQKIVDWEKLGYQIAGTANDGERAFQLIEEEKPDVLMTDIRMPGVDGMELIRRAKELRPDLVFIVVSGYRQFEYAQTALKYGVTDYLLKPVNAEELTQLLIRIREEEEKKKRLDNWTASVDRQLRENEWKKREQLECPLCLCKGRWCRHGYGTDGKTKRDLFRPEPYQETVWRWEKQERRHSTSQCKQQNQAAVWRRLRTACVQF